MGSYRIKFKKSAEKELRKIDKKQIPKILAAIEELTSSPSLSSSRKLVGSQKSYRLRIGDYRAVYTVEEDSKEIEIQKIKQRREVYR